MTRWSAGLSYELPEHIIVDQWGINRKIYIAYRWLACLYLLAWLIASIIEFTPPKAKYLLNITSWSFMLLNVTVAMRAVLATILLRKAHRAIHMTFILKLLWIFENISGVMAVGVTIGYWCLLNRDGKLPITAVTVHTHGVNGLYILIDLFSTAKPCRFLHFWHSMTFAGVYLTFSAIYWAVGGTGPRDQPYIYPALDWRKPSKTLLFSFLFGVVLTTLTHVLLCLLYEFRVWLHKKFINRRFKTKSSPEEAKELQVVFALPDPDEVKEFQDVFLVSSLA